MTVDPTVASEDVRKEILRAFRELRPQLIPNARKDADLDPHSRVGEFSDGDLEQIANAWEGVFVESLEGTGRQTRDLLFDTALPPIVEALGQSVQDMVRSNVITAVMLTHRLLPLIADEQREEAARWLAAFHSGYAYEMVERVTALQAGRG